MPIKRITISVPEKVAARIQQAAGSQPVSAWVTGVIEEHLDEAELEAQWQAFYSEVNPSQREKRQAKRIFDDLTRRKRRRGAA